MIMIWEDFKPKIFAPVRIQLTWIKEKARGGGYLKQRPVLLTIRETFDREGDDEDWLNQLSEKDIL